MHKRVEEGLVAYKSGLIFNIICSKALLKKFATKSAATYMVFEGAGKLIIHGITEILAYIQSPKINVYLCCSDPFSLFLLFFQPLLFL